MLLPKVFGIILLCSLTVTELITFRPFIKSRYSLRARAKITTKVPQVNINETAANLNPDVTIQHGSTQHLATTMTTSVNQNWQEPTGENRPHGDSDIMTTGQPDTPVVKIDAITTPSEVVSKNNEVTTQSAPRESPIVEVKTTTSPPMTAPTEWVYDYYASDDESPKKM